MNNYFPQNRSSYFRLNPICSLSLAIQSYRFHYVASNFSTKRNIEINHQTLSKCFQEQIYMPSINSPDPCSISCFQYQRHVVFIEWLDPIVTRGTRSDERTTIQCRKEILEIADDSLSWWGHSGSLVIGKSHESERQIDSFKVEPIWVYKAAL